jgi:site-specific DNA-adenine methylase
MWTTLNPIINLDKNSKNTKNTKNGKNFPANKIVAGFPQNIHNYYELSLGDGAILFELLNTVKNEYRYISGTIRAYDDDIVLIHTYKNIQTKHLELYARYKDIINEYEDFIDNIRQTFDNYIMWIQNRFNNLSQADRCSPLGSAMFLFLHNHSIKVEIDQYGNYHCKTVKNAGKIEVLDKGLLQEIHELIQKVEFTQQPQDPASANGFFKQYKLTEINGNGDFVYFNIPIFIVNDGEINNRTIRFCNELEENNHHFMLSVVGTTDMTLHKYFAKEKYYYYYVYSKHITRIKDNNAKECEIIITNYSG